MPGNCLFNDKWVDVWRSVRKTGDKYTARCALCLKDIDVVRVGGVGIEESCKIEKAFKFE